MVSPLVFDQEEASFCKERSSPHPFIVRVPRAFSLLLPLLICPLLFPFLGTPLSPVLLFFLIYLLLVW
jgi:hypothetical protein